MGRAWISSRAHRLRDFWSFVEERLMSQLQRADVERIYNGPLLELVFEAARVHRAHHDPRQVQCSTLINIKTGACPEDCGYCSQSAHHDADLESEALMSPSSVIEAARRAKAGGADRFCMGAAWRGASDNRDFEDVLAMVRGVKGLGLETCATLGLLGPEQAGQLKEAGLDYYNHNLDTSPEYYDKVITTRSFQDRLDTLDAARGAGMKLCCGGILGLGEERSDRVGLLFALASLDPQPESVPINTLVAVPGTPLEGQEPVPWDELVRAVAAARVLMPEAKVRLSAGRMSLSEEAQALAFLAGANSIFLGDKLLTTPNPQAGDDAALFDKLGLEGTPVEAAAPELFSV